MTSISIIRNTKMAVVEKVRVSRADHTRQVGHTAKKNRVYFQNKTP